jgi:hypothetical protein
MCRCLLPRAGAAARRGQDPGQEEDSVDFVCLRWSRSSLAGSIMLWRNHTRGGKEVAFGRTAPRPRLKTPRTKPCAHQPALQSPPKLNGLCGSRLCLGVCCLFCFRSPESGPASTGPNPSTFLQQFRTTTERVFQAGKLPMRDPRV